MGKNLLLISCTKIAGEKLLAHAKEEIRSILTGTKVVQFIPYARPSGITYDEYLAKLQPAFNEMGYTLKLIDEKESEKSIKDAEAIFVGGGNTWHLLKELKERGLMYHIREAVTNGVPYIGSSAGANVAGLTIGNTNDMPSAESYGLDALALVPFNVNPHYQDTVILTPEQRQAVLEIAPQLEILLDHQGEKRDERLKEYHALGNSETVVALREGAMLRVNYQRTERHVVLKGNKGATGAKVFWPPNAGWPKEPCEYKTGYLDFLVM